MLLVVATLYLGFVASLVAFGWLTSDHRTAEEKRLQAIQVATVAIESLELAPVPPGATWGNIQLECDMLDCKVDAEFEANESAIATWMRSSPTGLVPFATQPGRYVAPDYCPDGRGMGYFIKMDGPRVRISAFVEREACSAWCDTGLWGPSR